MTSRFRTGNRSGYGQSGRSLLCLAKDILRFGKTGFLIDMFLSAARQHPITFTALPFEDRICIVSARCGNILVLTAVFGVLQCVKPMVVIQAGLWQLFRSTYKRKKTRKPSSTAAKIFVLVALIDADLFLSLLNALTLIRASIDMSCLSSSVLEEAG
jgi:hypothetical protein